jgi:hypothetical protein
VGLIRDGPCSHHESVFFFFFFFLQKRQYPRRGFVRAVSSTRDLGYALTRSCAIFQIGPWLILQCQLLSSLYGGHVVGCLNHRCTWDDWGCPILILSKRRGEGKWIGIYTDPTRKWMEGVTQFSHSKRRKRAKLKRKGEGSSQKEANVKTRKGRKFHCGTSPICHKPKMDLDSRKH